MLKAARAQTEAREHADRGDLEGARKLLEETVTDLRRRAPGSVKEAELRAKADELDSQARMMVDGVWDAPASKMLHYSSREAQRGRPQRGKPTSGDSGPDDGHDAVGEE